MPEVLISHTSTGLSPTYTSHDYLYGNGTTDIGVVAGPNFWAHDTWIYGSGVQKTPGFKSRKGIARLKPGLAYHKYGWTESLGARVQYGGYARSATDSPPNPYVTPAVHTYDTSVTSGGSLAPNSPDTIHDYLQTETESQARNKFLDQLSGEGANLANTLGERVQTADQVATLLRRLAKSMISLKRGNVAAASRYLFGDAKKYRQLHAKDIANQWLELQYGWKPLCSDIYSLIQGLHQREASRVYIFRASQKTQHSGNTSQSWGLDPYGKNHGTVDTTVITKYMIMATPDGVLRAPASLGFTNPLEVLWEVTPWSFVVDWAFPIGNYLNQLSADHGWTFNDGCISVLRKEKKDYYWSYNPAPIVVGPKVWPILGQTETWTSNHTSNGHSEYWYYGRTPLSGFPQPKVPKFKNPFSVGHVENALALLYQAFHHTKSVIPYN